MNYYYWLQIANTLLVYSNSPRRDVEILLSFVTNRTRTFILSFPETLLTQQEKKKLEILVNRRKKGEPIAYLIGQREFWSLPLSISCFAFIPRPDTECLVSLALEHLQFRPSHLLDLGTGAGSIALALATERSDCIITAVDIKSNVLALASYNAKKLKINNVRFLQSDWFKSLTNQRFELIVSNPPYINKNDICLTHSDLRFEPRCSLISLQKGLADLYTIINQAPQYLNSKSWLLLEHGWKQSKNVRAFFKNAGFVSIATYCDYGDNERVTIGQWYI
ncbi:Release factor glutamine methyltransferase [Candidatus Ecksteinia adelgidicola]|nr:Release factor glutamine methyltransferase [Candidatus Ecksteinia adelgidicola]